MEALITIAIVTTGSASDVSAAEGSAQSSRGKPPDGNQPGDGEHIHQQDADPEHRDGDPELREGGQRRPVPAVRLPRATKPIGRASTSASAKESSVSGTVTDSREAISGPTGSELMNDWPRFSVSSYRTS